MNYHSGTSLAIFNDLGSGTLYGSYFVATNNPPDPIQISLNSNALSDLNAAIANGDSYFSIGGTLGDILVPEPSSLLLFISGFGLLGARWLRRS